MYHDPFGTLMLILVGLFIAALVITEISEWIGRCIHYRRFPARKSFEQEQRRRLWLRVVCEYHDSTLYYLDGVYKNEQLPLLLKAQAIARKREYTEYKKKRGQNENTTNK